ncbi:NAD(P)-dependent dehydrogenase (short-subunit alcohol dehydrogenase family) [Actinokineospora baliensis]|uniref:SDR family NAD(P)-dependent oxidoreductase n=1 Tax=Actinokineospora baliensis TaxID=547056 RepID=UPI001EF90391|nr:NAD(P)-dependent dehydrogenase (short-subunit alcohol dehydrogenase family) [Actinokineospora baliensis]
MSGRSVVVTGGNRGLGLACARAFAAAGDKVAVRLACARTFATARDKVAVTRRGTPGGLFGIKCDSQATSQAKRRHGLVEVPVAIVGEAL